MAAAAGTVQIVCQTVVIVLVSFVISRMASGTGWLITRRGPAYDFRVAAMAVRTGKVPAMIERFVGEPAMTVVGGCPGVGTVT